MPGIEVFPREFFERPVLDVARDLLGTHLVRRLRGGRRIVGRIVEVEAYDGPKDRACHASHGRTPRTDVMFGEGGHAYVYLVYGMHHCLNVVTGPPGYPAAVLVRAAELLDGSTGMEPSRRDQSPRSVQRPHFAASGPGRLARTFQIDRSLNRTDLSSAGPLALAPGDQVGDRDVLRGARIGVDYAGVWARKPWRLGVRGSPALSRPFPAKSGRSGRTR